MEYAEHQLKLIQKKLFKAHEGFKSAEGFGFLAEMADLRAWVTQALLAGYNVEASTAKMYKQKGNVRTYYDPTT